MRSRASIHGELNPAYETQPTSLIETRRVRNANPEDHYENPSYTVVLFMLIDRDEATWTDR